jgi:centrosomal protein CEP76
VSAREQRETERSEAGLEEVTAIREGGFRKSERARAPESERARERERETESEREREREKERKRDREREREKERERERERDQRQASRKLQPSGKEDSPSEPAFQQRQS